MTKATDDGLSKHERQKVNLMRSVALSAHRVFSGLASAPLHVAHLADQQTANTDLFASGALTHADLLECEAQKIRNAVRRYHEDQDNQ